MADTVTEKSERLRRILSETRQVAEPAPAHNVAARTAYMAEHAEREEAITEQRLADQRAAAPQTQRETIEAAHEATQQELRHKIGQLEQREGELYDAMIATGEGQRAIERKFSELVEKLGKRIDYASDGTAKRAWDPDFHRNLIATKTNDPEMRAHQSTVDKVMLMRAWFNKRDSNDDTRSKLAGCLPGLANITETREYQKAQRQLRALYTTGGNVGDEWVPDIMSAQVHELHEAERRLADKFPRITVPTGQSSFIIPFYTANPTVYKTGERTGNDGSNIEASQLTTDQRTLTPEVMAGRQRWSNEFNEDSIVGVADMTMKAFGKALKKAEENAIINGDTTATHLDTGETVAVNDVRRCWNGLRDLCITAAKKDMGTFSAANFGVWVSLMQEYASDPMELILIAGVSGYWSKLVVDTQHATAEKVGAFMAPGNATGLAPRYYGIETVLSSLIREDLNASGIYDNSTTTKTMMLLCRPDQYVIGERRGITVQVAEDIESQQHVMVVTLRETFAKLASTTAARTEALAYNLSQ